jgi:hypothetical protein
MSDFVGELTVTALSGNGIECSVRGHDEPFWLPRNGGHVKWEREPAEGQTIRATVAGWLVRKHRQLGGDGSDAKRDYQRPATSSPPQALEGEKDRDRDMSGFMFRNQRKQEGDRLPDYEGRLIVHGTKLRVAGWIKQGAKGKFLSLAVKEGS